MGRMECAEPECYNEKRGGNVGCLGCGIFRQIAAGPRQVDGRNLDGFEGCWTAWFEVLRWGYVTNRVRAPRGGIGGWLVEHCAPG